MTHSFGREVKRPPLLTLMTSSQVKGQSKRQKGYNTAVNFRKEMVGLNYEQTRCSVRPKAARSEVRELGHWSK